MKARNQFSLVSVVIGEEMNCAVEIKVKVGEVWI